MLKIQNNIFLMNLIILLKSIQFKKCATCLYKSFQTDLKLFIYHLRRLRKHHLNLDSGRGYNRTSSRDRVLVSYHQLVLREVRTWMRTNKKE